MLRSVSGSGSCAVCERCASSISAVASRERWCLTMVLIIDQLRTPKRWRGSRMGAASTRGRILADAASCSAAEGRGCRSGCRRPARASSSDLLCCKEIYWSCVAPPGERLPCHASPCHASSWHASPVASPSSSAVEPSRALDCDAWCTGALLLACGRLAQTRSWRSNQFWWKRCPHQPQLGWSRFFELEPPWSCIEACAFAIQELLLRRAL